LPYLRLERKRFASLRSSDRSLQYLVIRLPSGFGTPVMNFCCGLLSQVERFAPELFASSSVSGSFAWPTLVVGLLPGLALAAALYVRQRRVQHRLALAIRRIADGDYHWSRENGLALGVGELNEGLAGLTTVLVERERSAEQSEQLLHTLIDAAPMAILLLEEVGDIEYVNETGRTLFFEGREVVNKNFLSLLDEAPAPLREAVLDVQDRFFAVEQAGTSETYHLAKRHFELHGKTHTLLMVKHLTREIRRQEIDIWKKLIRVLSHELNNSLAPVTSLVHSARVLTASNGNSKLERVFTTIEERAVHLQQFVESYAKFARLPPPRQEHVNLGEFLRHLEALVPNVKIGPPPIATAYIDRMQMEQVAINLLKNAREAGGDENEIELALVVSKDGSLTLTVSDRGPGMSEQVLENAMLPFYSTKERGSGLGLALCREIVEAHGGRIRLENRDGGGLVVTIDLPGFERKQTTTTGKLTLSRL
jgi:nitrogen fixation/metabolism regulation signal transduction histidine kinase